MKPPLSYYGGKQNLAPIIIPMLPKHTLYCEPFFGGGAIFFNKPPSEVEVINDTNSEIINFYRVCQNDFTSLEKEVRISLHSRRLHSDASVVYNNPHLFNEVQRARAVWVLAQQSFSSMIDGSWGYDIKKRTTSKKIHNKRESFTEDFAIRLQQVQIECTDALRIIRSRDSKDSFFCEDPPYFNSDCGHYNGYTEGNFEELLQANSTMEGKFLLSSYPSKILSQYTKANNWHQREIQMTVSVASASAKPRKVKTEVLTANYDFNLTSST